MASNEHTQGQSLLAKEIAAFGYYTILYLKNPTISCEQFTSLVRLFHLPDVKDFPSFAREFEYFLRTCDLRTFLFKQDSSIQKVLDTLKNEETKLSLDNLNFSIEDLIEEVETENSTFGFDLFRELSLERNW